MVSSKDSSITGISAVEATFVSELADMVSIHNLVKYVLYLCRSAEMAEWLSPLFRQQFTELRTLCGDLQSLQLLPNSALRVDCALAMYHCIVHIQ